MGGRDAGCKHGEWSEEERMRAAKDGNNLVPIYFSSSLQLWLIPEGLWPFYQLQSLTQGLSRLCAFD